MANLAGLRHELNYYLVTSESQEIDELLLKKKILHISYDIK